MKISAILDHIDRMHLAPPEFECRYIENRNQRNGFMRSLYPKCPVLGSVVWLSLSEEPS